MKKIYTRTIAVVFRGRGFKSYSLWEGDVNESPEGTISGGYEKIMIFCLLTCAFVFIHMPVVSTCFYSFFSRLYLFLLVSFWLPLVFICFYSFTSRFYLSLSVSRVNNYSQL